jgi:hypothetical protein
MSGQKGPGAETSRTPISHFPKEHQQHSYPTARTQAPKRPSAALIKAGNAFLAPRRPA